MRVHVQDQDRLFKSYWLPIQQALDTSITEFVRHYLMKDGKILKEADVYFELKDRLVSSSSKQAEDFLRELHRHGMFYAKFVAPSRETDGDIALRLGRLQRLKVTVAYPFLLRVFDGWDSAALSKPQLLEVLDLLESFVIRRGICNMPSNQLRRMLPPMFDAAGGAGPNFVVGLRAGLGGPRCPDDDRFSAALVQESLYANSEKNARLRVILERLEQSFNHREQAELAGAQIEHVMPQTLTAMWIIEIGEDGEKQAPQFLHTLGNLTLTKYNSELSNKPYAEKRKALGESNFVLNRHFADVEKWTPDAIRQRGEILARRAVEIWPDMGRSAVRTETPRQSTVPPIAIRFRDTRLDVSTWRDAYIAMLNQFEEATPGLFSKIAKEKTFPKTIVEDERLLKRSKMRIGDAFINTHHSAEQFRGVCRKIARSAGFADHEYEFVLHETK